MAVIKKMNLAPNDTFVNKSVVVPSGSYILEFEKFVTHYETYSSNVWKFCEDSPSFCEWK